MTDDLVVKKLIVELRSADLETMTERQVRKKLEADLEEVRGGGVVQVDIVL